MLVARRGLLALEQLLAVLVQLQSGDLAVGGVDGQLHGLASDQLLLHLVNVDTPPSAVHTHDLSFSSLERAALDLNGITLADGDGANGVLLLQVLAEVGRKKLSSDAGGSCEVSFS